MYYGYIYGWVAVSVLIQSKNKNLVLIILASINSLKINIIIVQRFSTCGTWKTNRKTLYKKIEWVIVHINYYLVYLILLKI